MAHLARSNIRALKCVSHLSLRRASSRAIRRSPTLWQQQQENVPLRKYFWDRGNSASSHKTPKEQIEPTAEPPSATDIPSIRVESQNPNPIVARFPSGRFEFRPAQLRDSCECPACLHPSTQQKLFRTADIPQDITYSLAQVSAGDGGRTFQVRWKNDIPSSEHDHVSTFTESWLVDRARRFVSRPSSALGYPAMVDRRTIWDGANMSESIEFVEFEEYLSNDEALFKTLKLLEIYGLVFIRNIPDQEDAVVKIVNRIGPLKDTFYGRTWNVKSVPDAKNIAYTHQDLGLHMDLLYTRNPPYLQFLHSLRARSPGGESVFADAFHAARTLWRDDKESFDTLCRYNVPYQYHNDGEHYAQKRPTIELTPGRLNSAMESASAMPLISCINYSPPFQGPVGFTWGSSLGVEKYLKAIKRFAEVLDASESLYEYRLKEGECVIFNNRRVLHARRAFDVTQGERWLKGAYLDDEAFWSRVRVLRQTFEPDLVDAPSPDFSDGWGDHSWGLSNLNRQ